MEIKTKPLFSLSLTFRDTVSWNELLPTTRGPRAKTPSAVRHFCWFKKTRDVIYHLPRLSPLPLKKKKHGLEDKLPETRLYSRKCLKNLGVIKTGCTLGDR